MDDRAAVVRRFCDAWSGGTAETLADWFTDDAVYHNMPSAPVVGRDAIRDLLRGYLEKFSIDIQVVSLAANDRVVMTERVDVFVVDGRRVELPVMGSCEVTGGRIAAWRDYFDREQLWSQLR